MSLLAVFLQTLEPLLTSTLCNALLGLLGVARFIACRIGL